MTMRRLVLGAMMLTGLSVLSWVRADGPRAQTACGDAMCEADAARPCGGNRDEAVQRFRSNQPRHWRQLAIASR